MELLLQELGAQAGFSNVLLIGALLMGRIMPIILFAPFIGGSLVPSQVKLGVGLTLTLLVYPFVADTTIAPSALAFILLLLKEVFVGYVVAFLADFAFEAARAAGTLVDTMSGANMATVYVPQIQQQASLLADLKFQLAIVVFLALDGHHVVIQALVESFGPIPLNGWPAFSHGFWPLFERVMRTSADLVILAVALAAPASIAAFIVDVALGLVNRVAPAIQVFFIAMAIKPLVVVAITLAALTVLSERLLGIFHAMLHAVRQAVMLFS
jgi:flagellar biosynthetic protein FliR